jgi:protein-L-isoaspartate(D-aspartate) O-methyltransferase
VVGDPPELAGWHYQRQARIVENDQAPSGKRYVTFTNEQAGRWSQALQGMAVDGQQVKQLKVSAWVRARDVRPGEVLDQLPGIVITFYDQNRTPVGHGRLGSWHGSFRWQQESGTIAVPPRAREAVVSIGLLGAVGELSLDDLRIQRGGGK